MWLLPLVGRASLGGLTRPHQSSHPFSPRIPLLSSSFSVAHRLSRCCGGDQHVMTQPCRITHSRTCTTTYAPLQALISSSSHRTRMPSACRCRVLPHDLVQHQEIKSIGPMFHRPAEGQLNTEAPLSCPTGVVVVAMLCGVIEETEYRRCVGRVGCRSFEIRGERIQVAGIPAVCLCVGTVHGSL